MRKKPKLGLTIWTGMGARNIKNSAVSDRLGSDFNIEYLGIETASPNIQNALFLKNNFLSRALESLLHTVHYYAHWVLYKPETVKKYMDRNRKKNFLKHGILLVLGCLYGHYRRDRNFDIFRDLVYRLPSDRLKDFDCFFVTSTDIIEDQKLVYSAMRLSIPAIVLVHSWDNLPARGMLATRPTMLFVWNEVMKAQAEQIHGISSETIHVVGVPQYEYYKSLIKECHEEAFRHGLKIPLEKKIIVYTCAASHVFPDEALFVERLVDHVSKVPGVALVLRLHPEERKGTYLNRYSSSNFVILSVPDDGFRASIKSQAGSEASVKEFVSLMAYSSVVINLASTTTLDSILFDTPVICPRFNLSLSPTAWNAASRWYESTHFRLIAESGAIDIANSFEELEDQICSVLKDPDRLRTERMRLSEILMPELPTSELIASLINQGLR